MGSIPVVGGLVRQADSQARWLQEVLEQNARLVGQLPATLKAFNDTLQRFNDTVGRLDRMVERVEVIGGQLLGPLEDLAPRLERVRDLPELIDTLRKEAIPALRAATDTRSQVAVLQATLDRMLELIADLPGGGLVRRLTNPAAGPRPKPPTTG